tara:strand:+ start:5441 stop:5605 length:165 start_codon:yes stop_codon:yes gene_type:complete
MHSSKTVKLKITMTGETLLTKRVVEKPKTAGTGTGMNKVKYQLKVTYSKGAAFS